MPEQRRKYLRLPVESTAFIESLSPRAGQSDSGQLLRCKTLNVSRGGLQVALSEELTVGTILQIGVELPGEEDTLYLAGEVRWCLPSENKQHPWLAGFRVLNADNSDVDRWVDLVIAMEK